MIYRSKKPVIVEAFRPGIDFPVPDWFYKAFNEGQLYSRDNPLTIESIEGDMVCHPGDYLIKDISGKFYSYASWAFINMYEPVEE